MARKSIPFIQAFLYLERFIPTTSFQTFRPLSASTSHSPSKRDFLALRLSSFPDEEEKNSTLPKTYEAYSDESSPETDLPFHAMSLSLRYDNRR